ncbi:sigma-54-dependent Fis family transcriptional regulator [Alicyclobacillus fastidiosus]|uniref:Sigma-54-dependent Fis family transcriptional regulator n=1 Tax=Alicyclobacillus fastidiosus TaxID=392011 RepID=A0ABY6ZKT4_9BACL|nr:sigma-54-dependent Fis family transcriptional regulator [Alicyclobacillus fastidiosus]WAH43087.1 sigma-54-dependent Fis family transcriptional regulator [Alicyclobacillus fastidiosus]GMA65079.1 sigma-54-dependent Fis family transcriptional regulator [Alicyclobacillus fastidiosus]
MTLNMIDKDFTTSIQKAWYDYVEKGLNSSKLIRRDIFHSWERSRGFGVDPYQQQVKAVLTNDDLINRREKNKTLLSFAIPDTEYLSDFIVGSETIITIADKNGLILNSFGDNSILNKGEKIRLMPGAVWSEEVAGTNAIGTVIKTKKPVQVFFMEHFCNGWHDWFCAAAPILNPISNELIGVFDISGKWKNIHPHTLGLSISKANEISKSIEKNVYQYCLLGNPFLETQWGEWDDGIILADVNKRVVKMNAKSECFLRKRIHTLDDIPEFNQLVTYVLQEDQKVVEQEITLSEGRCRFICSIYSVMMDEDLIGFGIRLRESPSLLRGMKSISVERKDQSSTRYTFDHMIGSSPAFLKVVQQAKKAAMLDSNLFLAGETGTGKELFAQSIHQASRRRNKPFVAINCGAIPRELIESELFGYEPGAFTGAKSKGSYGKFELAHGGTIFLDEIGDMPLNLQVHLLRVLEEKCVTRIGGEKPIPLDIRVIAATNKNLMEAVQKGEFRRDLVHRLQVIQIKLPALRERSMDIPSLAQYFLQRLAPQFGKSNVIVDPETIRILQQYSWTGNIRELKNMIEQSLFNMEENTLLPCDLPSDLLDMVENPLKSERNLIISMIQQMDGSIPRAAVKLGISRATMYRKVKQYGITPNEF